MVAVRVKVGVYTMQESPCPHTLMSSPTVYYSYWRKDDWYLPPGMRALGHPLDREPQNHQANQLRRDSQIVPGCPDTMPRTAKPDGDVC